MRLVRLPALMLLAALALIGCGNSTRTVTVPVPTHRLPVKPGAVAPPKGEAVPSCTVQEQEEILHGKGSLGACTPTSPVALTPKLAPPRSSRAPTGPDVSNNDPISPSRRWRIVATHGHPFGATKLNQGTRFIDSTASAAAAGMRAAHIVSIGYDFLEVCVGSARAEANIFLSRMRRTHIEVAAGDAEFPLSAPCSSSRARRWVNEWVQAVHSATHHAVLLYTGAWWWNPQVGCYWPKNALPWISGYVGSFSQVAIPCRAPRVVLWQYTDRGFNGASSSDMSVLRVPLSTISSTAPTPAQRRAAKRASLRSHKRERAELHAAIDAHHCRKGQHVTPREPLRTRRRLHNELCPRWIKRGQVVIKIEKRLERELRRLT